MNLAPLPVPSSPLINVHFTQIFPSNAWQLRRLTTQSRVFQRAARRSPRGSALIVAAALILLLASLSAVLMNEMVTRSLRTEVAEEDLLAFEAAEAGVDAAIN